MGTITLDPLTHCGDCTHAWSRHLILQGAFRCTAVIKAGYRAPQREFCTCSATPPTKEPS
jgi:hypothetical protein